jgi:hypothetical protein
MREARPGSAHLVTCYRYCARRRDTDGGCASASPNLQQNACWSCWLISDVVQAEVRSKIASGAEIGQARSQSCSGDFGSLLRGTGTDVCCSVRDMTLLLSIRKSLQLFDHFHEIFRKRSEYFKHVVENACLMTQSIRDAGAYHTTLRYEGHENNQAVVSFSLYTSSGRALL